MTEASNTICLVCDGELDPESPEVVVVDNLNWHKKCLDYIPQTDNWDQINQKNGHVMLKRKIPEEDQAIWIDMSELLRAEEGFYDARGGYYDDG